MTCTPPKRRPFDPHASVREHARLHMCLAPAILCPVDAPRRRVRHVFTRVTSMTRNAAIGLHASRRIVFRVCRGVRLVEQMRGQWLHESRNCGDSGRP